MNKQYDCGDEYCIVTIFLMEIYCIIWDHLLHFIITSLVEIYPMIIDDYHLYLDHGHIMYPIWDTQSIL